MHFIELLILIGLACLLLIQASPVNKVADVTVEKATRSDETATNTRTLSCSRTRIYGSFNGPTFTDFPSTNPGPCNVNITAIRVWHFYVIDAIKLEYASKDEQAISKPKRGGSEGRISIIELEKGERVTGTAGMICKEMSGFFQGTHVRQITFFTEKENGEKITYGPYGRRSFIEHRSSCRMFALNGMITSIYGRVAHLESVGPYHDSTVLTGIGFYYTEKTLQNH